MRTKDRLVQDLEAAGAPAEMIQLAKDGYYDDYETTIAFPLLQLLHDAKHLELWSIVRGVMVGAYDCTREEAEEWMQREGHQLLASLKQEKATLDVQEEETKHE